MIKDRAQLVHLQQVHSQSCHWPGFCRLGDDSQSASHWAHRENHVYPGHAGTWVYYMSGVVNLLSLEKTNSHMTIIGVMDTELGSSKAMTNVCISPIQDPSWKCQVPTAIVSKVAHDSPVPGAEFIKDLPHLQGLYLADSTFHAQGKIDLLLGENVLDKFFIPGEHRQGPPDTPSAWNTIFGWVIRGIYRPTSNLPARQATVHSARGVAVENPDQALTRFWEVEEPPQQVTTLTPEEAQVQDHYAKNHIYIPSTGRYQVTLPRRAEAPPLGESREQALKRFKANERSVLHKGTWDKFQAVIQEYLDLGHAQPVSTQEMTLPATDCYYLPMHAVYKESSSTTKLRVVFDASAKTSTLTSLNDILMVGTLLLIRFCLGSEPTG